MLHALLKSFMILIIEETIDIEKFVQDTHIGDLVKTSKEHYTHLSFMGTRIMFNYVEAPRIIYSPKLSSVSPNHQQ